jgi:hypothetical protein
MPWYDSIKFIYNFLTINDVVEIALISGAIYYFSRWLRNDKQKNLLLYFYSYCTLLLGSYWIELNSASAFLWITAPIGLMLFILFHQESLQKNFVMLRNSVPLNEPKLRGEWLETLIGTCLAAANNNKTIHCVIEHKDSLNEMITAHLPLYADVQKNLLSMLLDSENFDQSKILWLNSHGRLLGLNADWNQQLEESWMAPNVKALDAWQQDALFYSAKTDAIVFRLNPKTRMFDIVAHGKTFNGVNAALTLKTIEKYVTFEIPKKGVGYEAAKKQSHEQRNS